MKTPLLSSATALVALIAAAFVAGCGNGQTNVSPVTTTISAEITPHQVSRGDVKPADDEAGDDDSNERGDNEAGDDRSEERGDGEAGDDTSQGDSR